MALPCPGQVYRWQDESGRVQYGDRPPPGVKAEPVNVSSDVPDAGLDAQRERREKLLDVFGDERERRREEQSKAEAERVQRAENCRKARAHMDEIRDASFLYEKSADPDNPRILTDEERAAYARQGEAEVARWCSP